MSFQSGLGVAFLAAGLALLGADSATAQCSKAGPKGQGNSSPSAGSLQRQQQLQQLLTQQMLFQQILQQGKGLVGLQQQNGLLNPVQPQSNALLTDLQQQQTALLMGLQAQSMLLTALKQQLQQNSLLIALPRKQQSYYQSGQTGGFATQTEALDFRATLASALQQTQDLLTSLEQQNLVPNQVRLQKLLQKQLTSMSDLAQRYGQSSSN